MLAFSSLFLLDDRTTTNDDASRSYIDLSNEEVEIYCPQPHRSTTSIKPNSRESPQRDVDKEASKEIQDILRCGQLESLITSSEEIGFPSPSRSNTPKPRSTVRLVPPPRSDNPLPRNASFWTSAKSNGFKGVEFGLLSFSPPSRDEPFLSHRARLHSKRFCQFDDTLEDPGAPSLPFPKNNGGPFMMDGYPQSFKIGVTGGNGLT